MPLTRHILALLVGASLTFASPLHPRQDDVDAKVQEIIKAAGDVPKYVEPNLARDITEWLAIGDSFAAGISADKPSDELNNACSRFKRAYPVQMNENPRFPGFSTSRKFIFGACTGAKMKDVENTQLQHGDPDLSAKNPKIGKPQMATLSISGNDLGFGDIVNACLYRWGFNPGDCNQLLRDAREKLEAPGKVFMLDIVGILSRVMAAGRVENDQFQLYVTGYIRFWNDQNPQCDDKTWISWPHDKIYLTRTLRKDMNDMVLKLNEQIKEAVETLAPHFGGMYFVDEFERQFDGHRFCEEENDPKYHENPIDDRTWFIHYNSPYQDASAVGLAEGTSLFHRVVDTLVPPIEGKTAEDQVKEAMAAGDGETKFPYLATPEATEKALRELAEKDPELAMLPTTWIRIMHPKGFGYTAMSDAVIDKVRRFGATGVEPDVPDTPPEPPKPTKGMTVMLQEVLFEIGPEYDWTFYSNPAGTFADPCPDPNGAKVAEHDAGFDKDLANPPFPEGEFDVKLDGKDCKYKSDGKGPGKLSCPDMDEVECKEHPDKAGGKDKINECSGQVAISWRYEYHSVAFCEW